MFSGPIGVAGVYPYAFTCDDVAGDTIVVPGHALAVNDEVVMFALPNGQGLPGGVSAGTSYWVKTVSGNRLTLSATQGGSTLDLTTVGEGTVAKIVGLTINYNITPVINAGQLVIQTG
jgi:hypothetical protein